jgi:chitinase
MKTVLFSLLTLSSVLLMGMKKAPADKPVVIGYVAGYNGVIDIEKIDATKLTHINYAFIDIKDNKAWLHNEVTDTTNFRKLNLLKQKKPSLKILISIGGWSWSKNFSDATLTDSSRKAFAVSSVDIIYKYDLDGVDIDWEYPNMNGDNNKFRPEDKVNYTLMFKALREELDRVQQLSKKKYLLTTAVGGFASFIRNTEMEKAQQYLDYINLMTYDYSFGVAGHHTNLYHSSDYEKENSANRAVKEFNRAGVPVSKLVMGIAFYSKSGMVATTENKGLKQRYTGTAKGGGYTYLKDSLIGRKGFTYYWDSAAHAPYLFNDSTKQFITFDDERSVKEKCAYVKQQQMGGVMFWEYSSDPKGYLLKVIDDFFKQQ